MASTEADAGRQTPHEPVRAAVETFHCPGDKGDSLWKDQFPKGIRSCYDGWGNSYLVVWAVETLRVKHVTGDSKASKDSPEATPMKSSEIARSPANKLIEGDWLWWADRDKNDPWSQWHNFKGQYRINVLFGDGHTEFFHVPERGLPVELHRSRSGSKLQVVVASPSG